MDSTSESTAHPEQTSLLPVRKWWELPLSLTRESLVSFLHQHMQPYHDTPEDIDRGLDRAFSSGGFVLLAIADQRLQGALALLRTGMAGYVPENMILFVGVDPALRGRGIGTRLIREAVRLSDGNIKLHVEYDNPAKRLYERLGFESKYAEMRLVKEGP